MKSPLVLALNPSVDVEWRVSDVRWEEKNDVLVERRWPGGKGVNVARWLRHLRAQPGLLIPLGGSTGVEMREGLRRERIPVEEISLRQPTRANVIVTARAGGQLRFNPLGPQLSEKEWRMVLDTTERLLPRASVMILSGSLPRGVPVNAYARLARMAAAAGVRALVDCDGPRFAEAVKAHPFLVKPNWHELEQWAGATLKSIHEVRREASRLSSITRGWVLVSLGKSGALLISEPLGYSAHATASRSKALNTVGAGDALLAAVAAQIQANQPPEEWLRWGVAAGTAATRCEAGVLPPMPAIRKVHREIRVKAYPSR